MIYTAALTICTALTLGVVYPALWGLLMEHIRISTEPRDDSRYEIERGED